MTSSSTREVFVVEDDPRLLSAIAQVLREERLQVRAFGRPDEALRAMELEPPALVITDGQMPQMSGHELMQRARERLGHRAPRFLLVTGAHMPRPLLSGFDAVLYKPFRLDDLLDEARRLTPTTFAPRRSGMRLKPGAKRPASDEEAGEG